MKIGMVGATGRYGKGLTFRWAKNHTIYVGSRFRDKGLEQARNYRLELEKYGIDAGKNLIGGSNEDAFINGDLVVLSIQFAHIMPLVEELSEHLQDKIVLSPIVSLKRGPWVEFVPPPEGSCALFVQKVLPKARVVSALHTIPAQRLCKPEQTLEGDVAGCDG